MSSPSPFPSSSSPSKNAAGPGQRAWGCGICLASVPPAYMAQFQVARRMQFGQDPNGLTRESKRELIISRLRQYVPAGYPYATSASAAAAAGSSSASSAAAGAAGEPKDDPLLIGVQCFAEEFTTNTNLDSMVIRATLCRRCFEFAYMIPPTTFDDCLHVVQKERGVK